jgi:hypothetical protein
MRNQMAVLAGIALLAASTQARAQAPKAEPSKPGAEKGAAPTPPAGPHKPPPENESFKKAVGNWTCEGTAKGPDGQETKYKSSWAVKPILNGHWYSIVYKRTRAGSPNTFEGNVIAGFDVVEKKYTFEGFDNAGGWLKLTSTDNANFTGEGVPGGKRTPAKLTFTAGKDKQGNESDKLFEATIEFGTVASSHESCKK